MPPRPGVPRDTRNVGLYVGTVVAVAGRTCSVEVPGLAAGYHYEAVRYPDRLLPALETSSAGDPAHVHGYGRALAPGDEVLVGFLAGNRDRPVIVDRLA